MVAGGRVAAMVMSSLERMVQPGITTAELDRTAEAIIRAAGAEPAFKGLYGFPATLCVSVNDEVVHGVPSARKLEVGDLVKLDLGVRYQGMCVDTARTVHVRDAGKLSAKHFFLAEAAREALEFGIRAAKPGATLKQVAAAIEWCAVVHNRYQIITGYTGHGIGADLHEEPTVANIEADASDLVLEPGMTIAIEPLLTWGSGETIIAEDGFTVKTADGAAAAHFEHTVLITDKGPQVLT